MKIRLFPLSHQTAGQHELIGRHVIIKSEKCPEYSKIKGRIIDESRNMITILDDDKKKRVPKAVVTLQFTLANDHEICLEGMRIIGRPEDRIKTYRRK